MSLLSTEYDPKDGQFHVLLNEDVELTLTPCQFIDFISQSNQLVDWVVENYFNGEMQSFLMSSHLDEHFDEPDSKDVAEYAAKWLKGIAKDDIGKGG